MKSKLLNYVFWLVIAAAFVGPGTVTTAAAAGAAHGYQLLWALLFSIFACIVLQEAAARLTIVTGLSLGQTLRKRFSSSVFVWLIGLSIFLGCMAYEAGNLLGAIGGISLLSSHLPQWAFTVIITGISIVLLYLGKTDQVAKVLGGLVAFMGLGLLYAAFSTGIDWLEAAKGVIIPRVPKGGTLLVLGLIGTTIVPYNIFLGAGMAEGKTLSNMRHGLIISVVLGGIISMAVLVLGAGLTESFSFESLYEKLRYTHGAWMGYVFVFGLFGAGFTSTITAALAGAMTIRSIHANGQDWGDDSKQFRGLWAIIVLAGCIFGVSGVKPIPVIIAAQAANGLILPLITLAIWVLMNRKSMLKEHINGFGWNVAMLITLLVTSALGGLNVVKAIFGSFNQTWRGEDGFLLWMVLFALGIGLIGCYLVIKERQKNENL